MRIWILFYSVIVLWKIIYEDSLGLIKKGIIWRYVMLVLIFLKFNLFKVFEK